MIGANYNMKKIILLVIAFLIVFLPKNPVFAYPDFDVISNPLGVNIEAGEGYLYFDVPSNIMIIERERITPHDNRGDRTYTNETRVPMPMSILRRPDEDENAYWQYRMYSIDENDGSRSIFEGVLEVRVRSGSNSLPDDSGGDSGGSGGSGGGSAPPQIDYTQILISIENSINNVVTNIQNLTSEVTNVNNSVQQVRNSVDSVRSSVDSMSQAVTNRIDTSNNLLTQIRNNLQTNNRVERPSVPNFDDIQEDNSPEQPTEAFEDNNNYFGEVEMNEIEATLPNPEGLEYERWEGVDEISEMSPDSEMNTSEEMAVNESFESSPLDDLDFSDLDDGFDLDFGDMESISDLELGSIDSSPSLDFGDIGNELAMEVGSVDREMTTEENMRTDQEMSLEEGQIYTQRELEYGSLDNEIRRNEMTLSYGEFSDPIRMRMDFNSSLGIMSPSSLTYVHDGNVPWDHNEYPHIEYNSLYPRDRRTTSAHGSGNLRMYPNLHYRTIERDGSGREGTYRHSLMP